MLFSEPKIPQSTTTNRQARAWQVSVLFSEPKIPQLTKRVFWSILRTSFSALQRAENSSSCEAVRLLREVQVSVLFSEPKIPQQTRNARFVHLRAVSVLFSEPKIPQSLHRRTN